MRPDGVVVDPPRFDHHAGLGEGIQDLAVEPLVAELRVEAFAAAIFPVTAELDKRRFRPHCVDPVPNALGNELRTVACWE